MSQRTWIVRPYREGDEDRILDLFKIVYPGREYEYDKWMRWWHWLYRENPAGSGYIWIAEDDGRVVALTSAIPILIKMDRRIIRGNIVSNSMTHPEYRRQGIFTNLNKQKNAELARSGIHVSYDFGGKGATQSIDERDFSAFIVTTTRTLVKPFNWRNTLQTKVRNPLLLTFGSSGGRLLQKVFYPAKRMPGIDGLSINEVSHFDDRINGFWGKVCDQYRIMVARNSDYLNWRYVAIPDLTYRIFVAEKPGEICGYVVSRALDRDNVKLGVIFDFQAVSPEIGQCLIAKAAECLNKEKADLIYCSSIINEPFLKSFTRNGFMSVPFAGLGFTVQSTDPGISRQYLSRQKNWYTQIGDTDFF